MTERLAGDDFPERSGPQDAKGSFSILPFKRETCRKGFFPHAFAAVFIYGEKFFAGLTGREKGGRFGKTGVETAGPFFPKKELKDLRNRRGNRYSAIRAEKRNCRRRDAKGQHGFFKCSARCRKNFAEIPSRPGSFAQRPFREIVFFCKKCYNH